ncbi:DsbA family oxidoreductase [Pseudoxanthomonas indica]|uniref:Predicted dithiol-disulfide isomerase, DsbA family n=1 Tax=Pseudoxanthomonas indica TaxID=428993 RepID=A0A1T5K719_9GAMM|nr:DsbA family oxidoreductase [Pseudoxanthomonas indica]GGD47135.1 2-hydroxychromene-2-carboxylate isomerase [Pseudoxanthomonas indica]SKC59325.1 Predicted dithiol-disulfide isomerase, DsbA family [Pseudoxanthomonas indica]
MTQTIKIDFVSDVVCPWCAIGLQALEQAIARVGSEVQVELHFQPFELNPQMAAEGEDVTEHLTKKYGMTDAQARENGEAIRQRGEALGFRFDMDRRRRIVNTFDAHRLLHWAELEGPAQQRALKHALLTAYFTDGRDVSSHEVLLDVVASTELNADRARAILASDEYAEAVRAQETFYQQQGIRAVPSVVFNDRHLIQGGQPVETFERALRQLAAQS